MTVHLELDINDSAHRSALQALLASFEPQGSRTARVAGPAVGHTVAEQAEETPTSAPDAAGADTSEAAPQNTVAPPAANPPENSAPAASAAGSDEFPGKTEWANVDKNGTPYNDSIHTGTGTKNQDGTWRYKRGTDRAQAEDLEARLRQAAGGGAPEQSAVAPPNSGAAPGSIFEKSDQGSSAVAPPGSATQAEPPAEINFQTLMRRMNTEGVTAEARDEALQAAGAQSLPQLATQPELVPTVYAFLFPNG